MNIHCQTFQTHLHQYTRVISRASNHAANSQYQAIRAQHSGCSNRAGDARDYLWLLSLAISPEVEGHHLIGVLEGLKLPAPAVPQLWEAMHQ